MSELLILYLGLINLLVFSLMSYDKAQAARGGRRIRERTLFSLSAAGGALGALAAMRLRRHKTKHASFVIGIPALLILNVLCVYVLLIA